MSINYWTKKINPIVEPSSLQGKPRTEDGMLPVIAPKAQYHLLVQGKPYFGIVCIVLISFILLGLWQLHALGATKTPLKVVTIGQNEGDSTMSLSQTVIGSKTGTKYYFPWCGALSRIKPENRVSFASPALARASGYLPAGNCKGVK